MRKLADPSNHAKVDFLYTEAEVGLTFAEIALASKDPDKQKGAIVNARKAYDTIGRLRKAVQLTAEQDARLDKTLLRLKQQLELLGEKL